MASKKKQRTLLAEFDGNYGRKGIIQVGEAICAVCKRERVCVIVDQSEGEYHSGNICGECASSATTSNTRA